MSEFEGLVRNVYGVPVKICEECPNNVYGGCSLWKCPYILAKRIAAYEDSGLSPEQAAEMAGRYR